MDTSENCDEDLVLSFSTLIEADGPDGISDAMVFAKDAFNCEWNWKALQSSAENTEVAL